MTGAARAPEAEPSPPRRSLIVSGLGRCGSSLLMQMLSAGGVACVGRPPAFEEPEARADNLTAEWIGAQGGRAFKLLDPQLASVRLAEQHAAVIFLTRDVREQAASMAKFGRLALGLQCSRAHRRRLAASLARDLPRARAAFGDLPRLEVRFEAFIERPHAAAVCLQDILRRFGFELDADAAARCVRPRAPSCLPGLLEVELLEDARGGTE